MARKIAIAQLITSATLLLSGCMSPDLYRLSPADHQSGYEYVNNVYVESFAGGKFDRYIVRNLNIDNKGNRVVTRKGGRFKATMDIFHSCPECGHAINQIIVGVAGNEKASSCIWSGTKSTRGWMTVEFEITIPDVSGIYYIRTRYAQAYECKAALDWWRIDRPNGPNSSSNIGFVHIKG